MIWIWIYGSVAALVLVAGGFDLARNDEYRGAEHAAQWMAGAVVWPVTALMLFGALIRMAWDLRA